MQESEYLNGREDLVEKLRAFPFLQNINTTHLLDMLQLSKIRVYEEGEIITKEGIYDSWIYLLIFGEVTITKGTSVLTRFTDSGDTFGELAVLDGQARSATATATAHTKCLAIDASFMDTLLPEEQTAFYSIFYRVLAEILSQRLRNTASELADAKEEINQLKQQLDNYR